MLSNKAKKEDWTVFQEPHVRDDNGEMYKPDLIFVREKQALVMEVTIKCECTEASLQEAATGKVRKYQHLHEHIQELANAGDTKFGGFPAGEWRKWFYGTNELLEALGLSKTWLEKTAWALASRALLTSADTVHIFASKAGSVA